MRGVALLYPPPPAFSNTINILFQFDFVALQQILVSRPAFPDAPHSPKTVPANRATAMPAPSMPAAAVRTVRKRPQTSPEKIRNSAPEKELSAPSVPRNTCRPPALRPIQARRHGAEEACCARKLATYFVSVRFIASHHAQPAPIRAALTRARCVGTELLRQDASG